ncbi:carbohydrate-binding module family 1 protein [Xylariomycetidae sp. FL0641]|nr:carbohydrate-binding module family 1 protein [Xylariomycetidae sp. FL0641]
MWFMTGGCGAWTSSLVSLAVVVSSVLAENLPLVTDSKCNCFQTNTTTSRFFKNHKFFDFRSLSQYARVPAPIADPQKAADAPVTNDFFKSKEWNDIWSIQTWNNSAQMGGNSDVTGSDATVLMVNSANNIYIQHNDDPKPESNTYMVMRTMRHENFQSAAEIESISLGYQYLSIRMYARTRGSPGAITAMFTFRNAGELAKVQEADLEVRTIDPPSSIQYTNQPSWNADGDIPQATRNVTKPGLVDWSDWQYHRMDWNPGSSNWFVDGNLVSSIQFQAPKDASQVMFNSWSDGGTWSGNMSVGSSAEMQIQWIDFVFNNTDGSAPTSTTGASATSTPPATGGFPGFPGFPGWPGSPQPPGNTGKAPQSCANVCSIDQTSKVGTPVLISQPQGTQSPGSPGTPGACAAAMYGQCAGKTWSGCTACAAGTTCKYQNEYYSQCL